MRPYTYILLVFLALTASCRKEIKHDYTQSSLELSLTESGNANQFSWSMVNTDDFVQYELYGSNEPIKDINNEGDIDGNLIFSTPKKKNNFFSDSTGESFSFKYFRVIARLENSILASNSIEDNQTFFIPEINTNSSFTILPIPSKKRFLILTRNGALRVSLFDYDKGEFIIQDKTLLGNSNTSFQLCMYQNKLAVCDLFGLYNGSSALVVYDLDNLSILAAHIHPANIPSFTGIYFLKNDHLVSRAYDSGYKLVEWNLTNNQFKTIESLSSSSDQYAFANYDTKYIVRYRSNTDSIRFFDVDQSGSITIGNKRTVSINSFSGRITQGVKQLIVNRTSHSLRDRNWQEIESFVGGANLFYHSASPDENFYVFQANSSLERGFHIYKSGGPSPIGFVPLFTNLQMRALFMDNEELIYIMNGISFNSNGLIIKKFKF